MKNFKLLIISGLLAVTCLAAVPSALAQAPGKNGAKQPDFVSGELLVKFSPGLTGQEVRQRVAEAQGRTVENLPVIGTVRVKVPPGQELASLARLQNRPGVEYVEPNYLAYAQETPDDPGFDTQWGLNKISFSDALDVIPGSGEVLVAVLDTGIDLDHPDFQCAVDGGQEKLVPGKTFVSGSTTPDDDNGHGSHVAGIVGACTNNGTGVAGVAPNARLMSVKVLDSNGYGSYSGLANGIIYAVNNGADIINLSLGGPDHSAALYDAIGYALEKGVLVVAAAGNKNSSPILYPAAYSETMAVGATNWGDVRADFSNYGVGMSVVAPGELIYSTLPNGGYGDGSGTSMATPFVAGLAALVWGLEPALTRAEVKDLIESTAVDLGTAGWDQYYGHGRIDAFAAIESLLMNRPQLLLSANGLSRSANDIAPVLFLTDDQTEPETRTLELSTTSVNWTAAVSPPVSWARVVSSEAAGNIITIAASRPDGDYGLYMTDLVVTGMTSTSNPKQIGPITFEDIIQIRYVEQLRRVHLPVIVRN